MSSLPLLCRRPAVMWLIAGVSIAAPVVAWAATPTVAVHKQPLNITAIVMFLVFVAFTLGITYWAARRTRTASDFYTAGGGITGFQNGMAITGDYVSAASCIPSFRFGDVLGERDG